MSMAIKSMLVYLNGIKKLNLLSSSKIDKFYKNGQLYVTSIGNLYSNFTAALGLRRSTDEGKVEALAAYGKPDKKTLIWLHSIIKIDYKIKI